MVSERSNPTRARIALLLGSAIAWSSCGDGVRQSAAPAVAPPVQRPAPNPAPAQPRTIPIDGYEVVRTIAHDANSFTQGLAIDAGELLESQGEYARSSLRLVELDTGIVTRKVDVEPMYFAEGLTVLRGLVYQLTWKEQRCLVYDRQELRLVGNLNYSGEGWGLATDGTSLILSDGSDKLRFFDPATMSVTRVLPVRALGRAQYQLNELEFVHGEIWANIWHSNLIARIDPVSGEVARYLDLSGILPAAEHPDAESVLNGIAWDAKNDRLFVTGKRWPKLFEIRVKAK